MLYLNVRNTQILLIKKQNKQTKKHSAQLAVSGQSLLQKYWVRVWRCWDSVRHLANNPLAIWSFSLVGETSVNHYTNKCIITNF